MKRPLLLLACVLGLALAAFPPAFAGVPADPEFAALSARVTNWATGNLAITISLGALIIGAVVGLARVTAMPALTSIVFAILFSLGAGLIAGIIGAVI
jgi:conjugal transfer pilus assembly protein TraA